MEIYIDTFDVSIDFVLLFVAICFFSSEPSSRDPGRTLIFTFNRRQLYIHMNRYFSIRFVSQLCIFHFFYFIISFQASSRSLCKLTDDVCNWFALRLWLIINEFHSSLLTYKSLQINIPVHPLSMDEPTNQPTKHPPSPKNQMIPSIQHYKSISCHLIIFFSVFFS